MDLLNFNFSSLFQGVDIIKHHFKFKHKLEMSVEFANCMDQQLTDIFIKKTGISSFRHVVVILTSNTVDFPFFVISEVVSKFPAFVCVIADCSPIEIYWKSKSGRIYKIDDKEIDCNDIEFWMEGLNPLLYNKLLYPKDTLPFKLKNIGYELVVTRILMDCTLEMELKEPLDDPSSQFSLMYDFINNFNNLSLKKQEKYGFVHNSNGFMDENGKMVLVINMGTAGFYFFKKLLLFLNDMNCFKKIEVC